MLLYCYVKITEEVFMLYWAIVFFIISMIAGVFGFTGIAAASAAVSQIFFVLFLFIFLLLALAIVLIKE